MPLADGLEDCVDLPHTITSAILHRIHIDNLMEIPKDKRPVRDLWDKPFQLEYYLDHMYDKGQPKKEKEWAEINLDEVE